MRYAIRNGEALAISPDAIKRDAGGFFLVSGPGVKESDRIGSIAVVHVRGALAHFDEGEGDSYEAIVARVRAEVEAEEPPSAIVLRLETPGGVAAGAYEASRSLRELGVRVPIVAYVDEMATSAAYALSCSCSEIVCPRSAILGSVGVISTMVSYAASNEALGIQVVTITSGECKADGHPNTPIGTAAVKRERARVEKFADQFFRLAGKARGLDPEDLRSYQAGLFVGGDAVRAGLADAVMSWRELIASLSATF